MTLYIVYVQELHIVLCCEWILVAEIRGDCAWFASLNWCVIS